MLCQHNHPVYSYTGLAISKNTLRAPRTRTAKCCEILVLWFPPLLSRYQPKGSWYQGRLRRNWLPFAPWRPPGPHELEAYRKEVEAARITFKGT